METFSALLALCAGNSLVTVVFPAQRPVTRSFDVFFDLRQNKRLRKQSWDWWFETPSRPFCRHCTDYAPMFISNHNANKTVCFQRKLCMPSAWRYNHILAYTFCRNQYCVRERWKEIAGFFTKWVYFPPWLRCALSCLLKKSLCLCILVLCHGLWNCSGPCWDPCPNFHVRSDHPELSASPIFEGGHLPGKAIVKCYFNTALHAYE